MFSKYSKLVFEPICDNITHMKFKIVKDTNPLIRKKSEEVALPLDPKTKSTLDEMLAYLKRSQDVDYAQRYNVRPGVGLAAVQIGLLQRMFVVYLDQGDGDIFQIEFVNPKIVETSFKKAALQNGEGCLSVDKDRQGLVHRYYKVKMQGYDAITGQEVAVTARGYLAIILQHEYDHLDGILYYDKIDKLNPDKALLGEEIL